MDRNPLYTKERATFHFQKIEKYYKQEAYEQALEEIESNRDLLGAALNMGQQVTLTKILTNSLVNTLYDVFQVDGNIARFDKLYLAYKTQLELHAAPKSYNDFTKFFQEKDKSIEFKNKTHRLGKFIPPDESIYIDPIKEEPVIVRVESKDQKAIDIEADFLASIGQPLFAPQDAILEINKERKDKEDYLPSENKPKGNRELIPEANNIESLFEVKTNSTQKSPVVTEFTVESINIVQEKNPIKPSTKPPVKESQTLEKSRPNRNPVSDKALNSEKIAPSNQKSSNQPKSQKKGTGKKKKRRKLSTFGIIVVTLTSALILYGGYYIYSSGIISDFFDSQEILNTDTEPEAPPIVTPEPEPMPEPEPEPEPALNYLLPSDTQELTYEDLEGLDAKETRLAVNEMFARKGWHFGFAGSNYDYFLSKDWYQPDENMTSPNQAEAQFSSIERANLQLLLEYEKSL